jgi:hypothetical protein
MMIENLLLCMDMDKEWTDTVCMTSCTEGLNALTSPFPFNPLQSSESEVHFDVEIAIKVLRQAGYHSHAVFLAERHQHHKWYLKIQLEDLKVKETRK